MISDPKNAQYAIAVCAQEIHFPDKAKTTSSSFALGAIGTAYVSTMLMGHDYLKNMLFNREMKEDERPTRILVAVFTHESLQVVIFGQPYRAERGSGAHPT